MPRHAINVRHRIRYFPDRRRHNGYCVEGRCLPDLDCLEAPSAPPCYSNRIVCLCSIRIWMHNYSRALTYQSLYEFRAYATKIENRRLIFVENYAKCAIFVVTIGIIEQSIAIRSDAIFPGNRTMFDMSRARTFCVLFMFVLLLKTDLTARSHENYSDGKALFLIALYLVDVNYFKNLV